MRRVSWQEFESAARAAVEAAAKENREREALAVAQSAGRASPQRGPGTELKSLLSKIGITASPGCACNRRAALMDINEDREPGWCLANVETICDWLQEEAANRKLPFVRAAAKMLVRAAIRSAQKKGTE